MNLFRLGSSALMLGFGVALSGCLNAPDYAIEPAIDFNRFDVVRIPRSSAGAAVDSIFIVVNFRDGDGDLGLSDEDLKRAPYKDTVGGPYNKGYGSNYFIRTFKKDNSGQFQPLFSTEADEEDSTFPRLGGTQDKPAPLKGTLRFRRFFFVRNTLPPGSVVRFEVSILDRALHQSNTITTPEVTLFR